MADIKGIEGLSMDELRDEIAKGGKFVLFPYCLSIVVMTFRRNSDIYFLRSGESAIAKAWPFALLSFFLGWWGFPWGLIWTPMALFQTLGGGKDVTQEVLGAMQYSNAPQEAPLAAPPIIDGTQPRNPWSDH